MVEVFRTILNMSITACYCVVAVLLVRALLRRAPKTYSYVLWSAVGFRLCCPVSFTAFFSLFEMWPFAVTRAYQGGALDYTHVNEGAADEIGTLLVDQALAGTAVSKDETWLTVGAIVWLVGLASLLVYGLVAAVRLHRRMANAVRLESNVYQSDQVRSPFILGIFRPRIYIPFGLDEDTLHYVLAHEQYHLRRRDPLVKAFAFALLILHWFNPLVWLAFYLMCRDMEMSCDEWVLAQEENVRKAYSTSLLSFAVNRRFAMPGPLAFGENDVTRRIKHVLEWKRPKVWATLLAVGGCVPVLLACIANPKLPVHQVDQALERYYDQMADELGTSRINYFDIQVLNETLFVGCSYDGKLGVAVLAYDEDKGYQLADVQRWENGVPRALDVRVTYHIQGGREYMLILSNNAKIARVEFTGDYRAKIPVETCPALLVVEYMAQYPEKTGFTMSYQFYDAAGNALGN